ncbi:hypothetical protein F2Q68_00036738 [Brassica cretica]|uniref:DUF642 domain-containing protein n=1 Tax=Brassica cretica TaxID=69181 RepID=A0A8S9H5V4_BRACR|nr:hypothetical protein F2Q68_00036738 [Brassica cretica]
MVGLTVVSLFLLLITTAANSAVVSFRDGILPNGDFELGPKPSDMKGTEVLNKMAIPNWEVTGFVEYISSGHKQGDMLLVVPAGKFAVRLGNEASIKQRLKVTVYSSSGWDLYAWAFQAESEVAEIMIHNPGQEEDPACGPLIDGVAMRSLYPPRPTNKNILKNGGFEEGPLVLSGATTGVLIPPFIEDDHSPLPGWMVESLKAVKYVDTEHFSIPQGRRAIELVAGKESAIAQVARTKCIFLRPFGVTTN